MHPSVIDIFASAGEPTAMIRPTELYNESWMLRLILDWAQRHAGESHPLAFLPDARWYSEALLPSAFLARRQGDDLAETWTHADGVVGHFTVGETTKEGLTLREGATQLVVVEAKMWSKLSSRTTNAPGYDQAARTVACIAETLRRADIESQPMERLAFLVVAPLDQIDSGVFGNRVTKASIRQRVQKRVDAYEGARDEWFDEWFIPTLDAIDLGVLSWEELLGGLDPSYRAFYGHCRLHNKPRISPSSRHAAVPPPPERRQRSGGRSYGGPKRTLMVYCPEICPDSFVHLSISRGSYRIRAYSGPKRFNGPWQEPGVPTASEFLDRFRFVHEFDVAKGRKSVNEREYWQRRTNELNRNYGIAGDSDA